MSISAALKTSISHKSRKGTDACGMVVHSGLYISVFSYIHQSLLIKVNTRNKLLTQKLLNKAISIINFAKLFLNFIDDTMI